jgi:hypothetical protein
MTASSERCWTVGSISRKKICRSAVAELVGILQRVSALVFLVQIKGGVRSLEVRDVHARRKRSQIGFRLTAFESSSPQILARVSSSLFAYRARGCAGALWRARWRCRSEMRGLRGAGVVYSFVTEGERGVGRFGACGV